MSLFTSRQIEVAERAAAGATMREIALKLGVSPQAVKKCLSRARERAREINGPNARSLPSGGKPPRFRPYSLLPTDYV